MQLLRLIPLSDSLCLGKGKLEFPFRRNVSAELSGQTLVFMRRFHFDPHFRSVRITRNRVTCDALLLADLCHSQRVYMHMGVPLLKIESRALETERSCAAYQSPRISFWGKSFHVLLTFIFPFECFPAYFAYLLFMAFDTDSPRGPSHALSHCWLKQSASPIFHPFTGTHFSGSADGFSAAAVSYRFSYNFQNCIRVVFTD